MSTPTYPLNSIFAFFKYLSTLDKSFDLRIVSRPLTSLRKASKRLTRGFVRFKSLIAFYSLSTIFIDDLRLIVLSGDIALIDLTFSFDSNKVY